MMKYLGLIAGWFLVAVVLLVLLVVVAVVPFGGLTAALLGKVFGLWLLVGLVGLALGAVIGYYKVKGLVKDLKEFTQDLGSSETAMVSSYLPIIQKAGGEPARKFAQDPQAQKFHQEMLDAGFVHEGDFVMLEMPTLVFAGYTHAEKNLYGMVSLLAGHGAWSEISGDFLDGTNLFVSGLMQPLVMDTRPNVMRVTQPGASVTEQLELFERNKPGGTRIVEVAPGSFKKNLELFWWTDKAWRRNRGGTTMDELRRMRAAGTVGDSDTSDEQLKIALDLENQKWQEAWTQVPGQLIDRHLKAAGIDENSDVYFDRQIRLVAAFEGQTTDEFLSYLSDRLHNLHDQGREQAGEDDSEATQSFKPSNFRPGVDGFKLAAAADGSADGLTGADAIGRKYPDWFRLVHAGEHPMRHVIYEVG